MSAIQDQRPMAASGMVNYTRRGSVALIIIENPPLNAGSTAIRTGLVAAVARFTADPDARAAVLAGAGKTFMAGSDLSEFGKPINRPTLPEVIAAIEDCPKPVIAAIHGVALGGGLELILVFAPRSTNPISAERRSADNASLRRASSPYRHWPGSPSSKRFGPSKPSRRKTTPTAITPSVRSSIPASARSSGRSTITIRR